jgi:hypothetical protein
MPVDMAQVSTLGLVGGQRLAATQRSGNEPHFVYFTPAVSECQFQAEETMSSRP